ncbi:unnamed protein product [Owenia fusiformis]|uniref:Dipeptidyl peptidase 3 n=1 Tax=Owenia fusiformis TaxID=6347 RepID=A0A8S4PGQ1_OWEFU|nr:unnamed protein product [Owenia fusiformis]
MSDQYVLQPNTGIVLLGCKTAFDGLTNKEKLYAHYLSQAAWYGGLIVLVQTSPEAPGLYVLLQRLFKGQPLADLQQTATNNGLTDEEYQAVLLYAAGVFSNMGNYKSFGDTKFIPSLPKEKFQNLVLNSAAYKADSKSIEKLWNKVSGPMYSLGPKVNQLGLGDKGTTTYFSANCSQVDADLANQFIEQKHISPYNTRLFKISDSEYEIKLASVCTTDDPAPIPGFEEKPIIGCHAFTPNNSDKSYTFKVTRGDYSKLMKLVVDNLTKAKQYAANENQEKMLEHYCKSFSCGSIHSHKSGSKFWIRDKGPVVESYIGFIESYRDPNGLRGEFEGFVSMVNKEMSAKFTDLVAKAEHFLPLLPWGTAFEKDEFLKPDFTSLDVLTFGGSGIPAGINIPNYDDIRQSDGFKNVSLGNVLSSGYKDQIITFLTDEDKELYGTLKAASFEVQVGLHELLGHGSGKLFHRNADGTFDFDTEHVKNPLTNEPISSWYEPGQTWDSVFSAVASSYEECRAECVGIYLCLSAEILRIFGHEGDTADNIIYINWLNMVRAGLCGLEFYTPENQQWRQAHMQARFVILRVLLEAGEGLVTIEKLQGKDGQPDLIIRLDRSKINSVGKPAIGNFLQKLQIYKATADLKGGKDLYDHFSAVTDDEPNHFLTIRNIVLARKQPRKMFVQCNTKVNGDTTELVEYESSSTGLVQSFMERFPEGLVEPILNELWESDAAHFS